MDGLSRIGRILFGIAMALFGLLFLSHAHGKGLVPGPPWTAETGTFAWLIGAGFIAAGSCIVLGKRLRMAAGALGAVFVLRMLIVFVPRLIAQPRDPGPWTSGFEVLALGAVAIMIAGKSTDFRAWPTLVLVGRLLFAVALVVFGVQHFMYAKFVAALVTPWIPGHLFWAYFIGIAFVAAATSIATRVQAYLAASLLGLMFLLWVMVLHLPRVVAAPHNGNEWTSAIVALAMSGGSFVLTMAEEAQKS